SLHKYLYCQNDPVNKWDPLGLLYEDTNFTWSYGILRGAGHGAAWGLGTGSPWGVLGGAIAGGALGGFGLTGGGMMDFETKMFHLYGGGAWSSSLKGGLSGTLSFGGGNVETGWNWGLAWNVGRGYGQIGSTLFRKENKSFKEAGSTLFGNDLFGISLSMFYVFPGGIGKPANRNTDSFESFFNSFQDLDLIDQAYLMGTMIQDTGQAIREGEAGLPFWLMGVNVARMYGM
ncbi:MAG: hypothetical protein ACYSSI_14680, partial [Planctomycetota bacterium]